jgi:hypothetical protein
VKKALILLLLILTFILCALSCTGGKAPDTTDGESTDSQTAAPTEDGETTATPTDESTVTDTEPDTEPDNQPEDTSPAGAVMADVYPTPTEIT